MTIMIVVTLAFFIYFNSYDVCTMFYKDLFMHESRFIYQLVYSYIILQLCVFIESCMSQGVIKGMKIINGMFMLYLSYLND